MSKQPTRQVISSTNQKWLQEMQREAEQYRGLRTTLYPGELIIHLIDSEKYWKKQSRRKKKSEYDDDYDER